jgi:hypothetical protein
MLSLNFFGWPRPDRYLQHFFNRHVFELELAEYSREGVGDQISITSVSIRTYLGQLPASPRRCLCRNTKKYRGFLHAAHSLPGANTGMRIIVRCLTFS